MEACGSTFLISTTYLVASIIFFSSQVLGCQDSPVGIANSSVIPDDRFTATSSWSNVKNEPWDARLNGTDYGWAPRTKYDPLDYLQIDLGQAFLICAVATQGCSGCGWIEWTTQYKISSSIDNNTWVVYKNGTNDKLFPGNTDCNTVVKNVLDVPVLVRYIRFIPIAYYGWKTVRLEAYGHKRDHQWTLPPPRVENITSTSATVRWSKPSQANVTSFIIKYENNNNTGVLNVSGSEVSANITDLTPYTNYSISIKAMSTAGHGQWSGSTNFRTASARPYVFPVSVAANSLTSQSIRVTWQASKCGSNGPLRGYKISCAPISVNRTKEYATKAEQTSYNITNLEKWAEYRITVKCFNDNGEGPASVEVIVRTLEDAPGKPENFEAMVLSSTSIQLEWALPTETNGIIRGFKLRYENLTQNIGSSTNETLSANATLSYLLTGLERCTPYSFKLLAYTIKDGPYTDAIQRTTAENDCKYNAAVGIADPNIIPDNRFTATSSWFNNRNQPWDARLNGADYGWAPRTPSDSSDYLQIDLGQDFVICAVATQGCNGCSERTTQYKISTSVNGVWATYKNGIADKLFPGNTDSNTVVKNVLDVPVLVRYIRFIPTAYNTWKTLRVEAYGFMKDLQWTSPAPRVENLTSTSATVRWRKPNQANVTSFIIKYENNNNTGVLNVSGSEVSANITDLTPYTNYSVKIKAVSKTGHGQWSCSTNFSTDSARPETSPMSVTLYSPTSQSIHVTWQAPTSGINGPFLGYRVFCISGSDRRESTATPQQTGHTFSALRKWTVYNVTVVVRNDKGDGPINAYVTLRTLEDAPGQPQRFQVTVLSSTAVQLNWSLPSETNGIIRGFKLRYEKTGNWLEKDLPGNTTLSYVLTGLDKRTQYSFKMLAYTIKEGPLTPAILKTTPEDGKN